MLSYFFVLKYNLKTIKRVINSDAINEHQIPFNPHKIAITIAQITIAITPLVIEATDAFSGWSVAEKYVTITRFIPANI